MKQKVVRWAEEQTKDHKRLWIPIVYLSHRDEFSLIRIVWVHTCIR